MLASVAPYPARDLDFMAGMGQDNVEEFTAAIAGFDELDALLLPMLGTVCSRPSTSQRFAGAFGEELAMATRRAAATGTGGWRDDDLAFVKSGGVAVSDITVPVAV